MRNVGMFVLCLALSVMCVSIVTMSGALVELYLHNPRVDGTDLWMVQMLGLVFAPPFGLLLGLPTAWLRSGRPIVPYMSIVFAVSLVVSCTMGVFLPNIGDTRLLIWTFGYAAGWATSMYLVKPLNPHLMKGEET